MDTTAHATDLLDRNRYLVLATADADGMPWVTPVWFAADGLERVLWLSRPSARHSLLIATRPDVALTVFDSSRPSQEAAAFYATARAGRCADDDLDPALEVLAARSRAHGLEAFTRQRVTGDAALRVYVAVLVGTWVLDQDSPVDRRVRVEP